MNFILSLLLAAPLLTAASGISTSVTGTPMDRSSEPKKDTIFVAGHSHMDMNWLWTQGETIKMADDNLRQMVALFREYPDFKMVQSQPAVYDFVKKNDPALYEEIKRYVKEGRLEPVGGSWTESDNNLASGEALARAFLLGQSFYREEFGRMARIGWFPDDFGHNSQMPQILRLSGIDSYFFTRCAPIRGSFTWEGSDGSRVTAYSPHIYNARFGKDAAGYLESSPATDHSTLICVGVGDHGGGPTKADIDSVLALNADPDFPTAYFATASEFIDAIKPEMDSRPVHKGEMQFIFEGCYTSVAEVKEYNRKCENMLYTDEWFNSLNWLQGGEYPEEEIKETWKTVAFNQFHDILPGSGVYEANRENVARYEGAYRAAKTGADIAAWKCFDAIPFQSSIGQPVVVCNMQPFARKALVEVEVFSYDLPASATLANWMQFYETKSGVTDTGKGMNCSVMVRDSEGRVYSGQVVEGKQAPPGWRSKIQFVVDSLPAGYKTFYVDVTRPAEDPTALSCEGNRIRTNYFDIAFDAQTGDIVSLVDLRSGKEYVAPDARLNTMRIYNEVKHGMMKAWTLNHAETVEEVQTVPGSVKVTSGPVRACIECIRKWGRSTIKVRTYIYRDYPRIDYDLDVDWLEWGGDDVESPLLRTSFPLNMDPDAVLYCQTPFDVVERPSNGKFRGGEIPIWLDNNETRMYMPTCETRFGREVPAHKWSDVSDGKDGIALLNNSKYGYCYDGGEFRLSLMRCGGWPDQYPNLGRFNIRYSIMPHKGLWSDAGVLQEGEAFNVPAYATEPLSTSLKASEKTMPEEMRLFELDNRNVQMAAVKRSEDGKMLIVRLCEMAGEDSSISLALPFSPAGAFRLDILERPLKGVDAPSLEGDVVKLQIKPHEIVTLGLPLDRKDARRLERACRR